MSTYCSPRESRPAQKGEFACENGYVPELVYLEVSLEKVQARMVRNRMTAARPTIEANVFREHVQKFEPPQTDEVATVLRNAEDVSRWIESRRCPSRFMVG
jgi:hypothetical protein